MTRAHPDTWLRGRWLLLAWVGWMAVVIATLGLFAVGAPGFFAELQGTCEGTTCERWLLSPEQARGLEEIGLPPGFYAAYKIALEALFVLSFCVVAAVIFWRRSGDWMALFAAIMLVAFGGNVFIDTKHALADSSPVWFWPANFMDFLGSTALFVFFYLFPDGRFVPRWTRWTALGWAALNVVGYFSPRSFFLNEQSVIFPILALAFFLSVFGAQVYRYRRVSGPAQRQQTKWVVFGFAAAITGLFVNVLGKKYGAKETLKTFAAKLRDETDLDRLGDELIRVVRGTMQPAQASLWLRPAHPEEARGRAREARG